MVSLVGWPIVRFASKRRSPRRSNAARRRKMTVSALCAHPEYVAPASVRGVGAAGRGAPDTYRRACSQRRQPCQEGLIVSPDWLGAGRVCVGGWRLTESKCRLFCAHGDLRVPVGGLEADMARPAPNHIDVDPGFEQMDGARMSKQVRADVVACGTSFRRTQLARMATDDLVDAETREAAAARG